MPFSAYLKTNLLNHVFRSDVSNTAYVPPATVWVAFHSGNPGNDGLSNELVGGSYVRQQGHFVVPGTIQDYIVNQNILNFPSLPLSAVSYISLWDDQLAGNMLIYDTISTISVSSGDTVLFPAATLRLALLTS